MKKRDALDRLLDHCQRLVTHPIPQPIEGEQIQPALEECERRVNKTRRLVRALLRERAWAAQDAVREYEEDTGILFDANVRAAVLNRPKKGARK